MKSNKIADEWRKEGNLLYQRSEFRDAIIAYNKSLCHSEPGSKQLSLAYGNRSATYLEIGLHQECLENIQLARENNHPDAQKLKDREAKCLEAQTRKKSLKHDPEELIKLSYEPNKKIPFIVNCLELKTDEQYGRHIITNRDLSPGDIIAIEKPVLKAMEQVEHRYERCIFCLERKKHNLVPCNKCSISKLNLVLILKSFLICFMLTSDVLFGKLREGVEEKVSRD
jgi:SET and MYND domain-containing protein 4